MLSVSLRAFNKDHALPGAAAIVATLAIGGLVVMDGAVPSAFTTLFFIPIIFVAYRYPLPLSLLVVALASVFSSPAMELASVSLDSSVMPVLWLGWPAVYLFLAVSLNQWSSIQAQRGKLEESERGLMDVSERNDRRERELETVSAIHTTILSESGERRSSMRSRAGWRRCAARRYARSSCRLARRTSGRSFRLALRTRYTTATSRTVGRSAKALRAGRCCTAASPPRATCSRTRATIRRGTSRRLWASPQRQRRRWSSTTTCAARC